MKRSALFDPVFERRKIHRQSDLISSLTVKVNDLSAAGAYPGGVLWVLEHPPKLPYT